MDSIGPLQICICGHFKRKHDYAGCVLNNCLCDKYEQKW